MGLSKKNPFVSGGIVRKDYRRRIVPNKGGAKVVTPDGEEIEGVIGFELTPKAYDRDHFTKVFDVGWRVFMDLSKPAQGTIVYLLTNLRGDSVKFSMPECLAFTGYKNHEYIYRALAELTSKGVIAPSGKRGLYFINPKMFYNGDRMKLLNK